MIKLMKRKKKAQNQGNTYIMVVATLSFLAVLVAAMLVAVALCYRLKAYDINSRDNFYYLEQAMDEIYAAVGADAMQHLNKAYDETIEVLVYFDPSSQAYVTMKNEDANNILKNTYMSLVQKDVNYQSSSSVRSRMIAAMSNVYSASTNPEGIKVSVGNINKSNDELIIRDLVLKREAKYSTVNTRKTKTDAGVVVSAGDTFVQTITTDLVIGKPEFDVNFNTIDSDLNELYKFAFVADKGVEINNASSKVNITGNIYAAADFYNKDYNITDSNAANYISKSESDGSATKYAAVSSYTDDSDSRYANADGKQEKSMYSGLYIDGADVIIFADRIIVPGTIAAFNSAELTIAGTNASEFNTSEIWADGIVLGGYSLVKDPTDMSVEGSVVNLRANAYISDDLELNAEASKFQMVGQYYGYNYASLDNRTYTDVCLSANGKRTFTDMVPNTIADGSTIEGQAHYNSSAVIVNGQNSSLDLSSVSSMYIAGQAYVEVSKTTTKNDKTTNSDGSVTEHQYTVEDANGDLQVVSYTRDTYDYKEKGKRTATVKEKREKVDENGDPVLDADGNPIYEVVEVTKEVDDNYTTDTEKVENDEASTNLQDYRTGEAISIKSNQLAYIPNWMVTDTEDGLYLSVPKGLQNMPLLNEFWDDGDDALDTIAKIPVIKSMVSGKEYYFFDFSTEATERAGITNAQDVDVMNRFIEAYAELFNLKEGQTVSDGETYGLTDITDYDHFQIEMLKVNTSYDQNDAPMTDSNDNYTNIYTNSAITVKNGTNFSIKADSKSIEPLLKAAANLNANVAERNLYITDNSNYVNGGVVITSDPYLLADRVTTELQSQYQEVKWTLSPKSTNKQAVADAHAMEESDMTPINYFFYFNKLNAQWKDIIARLNSGYKIWICKGDVEINTDDFADGNVKGMVICKGDVTFTDDVKSFEGLIVSGSKIKVEHSMTLTANEEIVKTILRECDESQLNAGSKNYFAVCELFQQYQSVYKPKEDDGSIETESAKSISAVQFEDILSFANWMKNVD